MSRFYMENYKFESGEPEGSNDEELLPRQSGSLQWRQERGETGTDPDTMSMMAGYSHVTKQS
jgi:hypothetical protein